MKPAYLSQPGGQLLLLLYRAADTAIAVAGRDYSRQPVPRRPRRRPDCVPWKCRARLCVFVIGREAFLNFVVFFSSVFVRSFKPDSIGRRVIVVRTILVGIRLTVVLLAPVRLFPPPISSCCTTCWFFCCRSIVWVWHIHSSSMFRAICLARSQG